MDELEQARQNFIRASKSFAALMKRFDEEGQNLTLREFDVAANSLKACWHVYQAKRLGYRTFTAEETAERIKQLEEGA